MDSHVFAAVARLVGRWISMAVLLVSAAVAGTTIAQEKPQAPAKVGAAVTIAVAARDFEFHGDWVAQNDKGQSVLWANPEAIKHPAATAVMIPRDGRYRLWVSAKDFATDRPGTRTLGASVAGKASEATFGKSGKDGYTWEDGGWFDLKKGPTLITLERPKPYARVHGVVLTTDEKLTPRKFVGPTGMPPTMPLAIGRKEAGPAEEAALTITGDRPMATLSNELVQVEFLPARRGSLETVATRIKLRAGEAWAEAGGDPSAEGYFAVIADESVKLTFAGYYPAWQRGDRDVLEVEAGGVRVQTTSGRTSRAVYDAGKRERMIPRSATVDGKAVRIEFHPSPAGKMSATWQLPPQRKDAAVTLSFTPTAAGQVTLGYELFFKRDIAQVSELLLPLMYHRKRLPEQPITLLDNVTPTPIALAQPAGDAPVTFAVVGDPGNIAFGWPDGRKARLGMSIRGTSGKVHPSAWGPIIGAPGSAVKAGQPVSLAVRVLVQRGDWYAAFRTAADEIYGLQDYRSNVTVSLTDAALNMIDLLMDDEHAGWWTRAKAFYQIESKNGSTHASPMLPLSIYRLTGNADVYRRRALPTIEYALSRESAHFSPVPDDTGVYTPGSMNGPIKLFGTSTYSGLWELSGRRTPALAAIALPPEESIKTTAGYSHAQAFDEWMARYLVTKEPADLAKACELADQYIQQHITTAPRKDLGPEPFFFIHFVPNWEGLLRLYEVTGKKQYLEASLFGARQLMTGLWNQPLFPAGPITIHPGGQYEDEHPHQWWRGPERTRLGYPRKPGDTPEKQVPAWVVSNVGLGYEQPSTIRSRGTDRLIFQMGWSAHFLRLYRYTRDPALVTCARNAVVGRWSNYPGYYCTGLTDMPQKPDYPLTGPDVNDFYYHHIPPHLAWTIDYLVSEAEMLSDGKVAFPSLRQHGYAYFDSRIFGHAPGRVFDDEGAWLLFRRGVVTLDNVQANYLLAHGGGKLHVILTNQSAKPQSVTVALSPKLNTAATRASLRDAAAQALAVEWTGGRATVPLPSRGLAVLTINGVTIDAPTIQPIEKPRKFDGPAFVEVKDAVAITRAVAVQSDPGAWDASIWSTASPKQAKSATLHYALGEGNWNAARCERYPFEFSIPVADEKTVVRFKMELTTPDGKVVAGPEGTVGTQR